jgi:hypothetical protein
VVKAKFFCFCFFFTAIIVNPVISQNDFYNTDSVREVRIYFQESNWDYILDSLHTYVGEDGRLLGDVVIDGKLLHNIGVRYKGYSSFNPSVVKSPFNIDLEYNYNSQNYEGYTKLKLSNVIGDPSFIREVLSYEIARKYMPASMANFANVYVNDTLLGLYTNVEAVDKNYVEKRYDSRNNSFFKGAPENLDTSPGDNASLAYSHGADTTGYKPYYKLESDDSETGWPDLLRLIYILNNDTVNLDTVLNIDQTLWMHALNYSIVNLDSYIGYSQNYYLYMDDNGRFNTNVWDFNLSFGSFRETDGISSLSSLTYLQAVPKLKKLNPLGILTADAYPPRPLIKNLLLNSTYKRMFLAHMRTIINENFKNGYYYTRAQELQNNIDTFVQNDNNKFYSYSDFLTNLDTTTGSGSSKYIGLKELMYGRMSYLDTFPGIQGAPVISDIAHDPEYPENGNETWIQAKISGANDIFLAYRFKTKGIFLRAPMYDDGSHHDGIAGDGIYGASFIFSGHALQYYIYAQNDSAGIFSPERAEYEFYTIQPAAQPGDIVINEIMAKNTNSVSDQNSEYDPWIELFNTTNENISLKTLYLSDDPEIPTKWAFPDTAIKAKSFISIWADNDVTQNGLHTNFNFYEDGGQLILYCQNNIVIDSVAFGIQTSGKTYGRYPNGSGPFVYMLPTPGKYNYVGTTPLSGILLYPNPADNKISMEFSSAENIQSVEIFNSSGQKIISENFPGQGLTDSEIYSINIIELHDGIYILKVVTENNALTKRFVVVKEKLY